MSTQKKLCLALILTLGCTGLSTQTFSQDLQPIAYQLMSKREIYRDTTIQVFTRARAGETIPDMKAYVRKSEFLRVIPASVALIQEIRPELLQLPIPISDNSLVLELYRVEIFTESYVIRTSGGQSYPRSENMVFYRGIVGGDPSSIAIVSILDKEIRIMFSTHDGNSRIQRQQNDQYIFFSDQDIYQLGQYACGVTEEHHSNVNESTPQRMPLTGNCVEIYFECDFKSFVDNDSSVANTEAWVAAIFNEVSAIYDNEDIPIHISDIMVWTAPDPYVNLTSTNALLNEFLNQTEENGYVGRLAHLLSTRSLGGGIAFVDVLCSLTLAGAVSTSLSTNVVAFPNYSWNVNVISHEMGHNFGSSHTHSCVWNGNNTQIDDCGSVYGNVQSCYDSENPILPEDGTIMSYCHLVSGVGINFALGFGPQPGNRIRDEYLTASCNTGICAPPACTVISIPVSFAIQVDVATMITWVSVPGAAGYYLSIGTEPGLGDIIDTVDVGLVTSYNPILNFEFSTIIFITVMAYNNMGNAIACAEEHFTTEANVIPECTQLTSPLDGAINVLTSADLFWTPSIGNESGYRLTIGTSPGGGEILNLFDVGNVNTYDPGAFLGSAVIYVGIFPYWPDGNSPGCLEESFTTADPVYCASRGSNVEDEWISAVSFGPLSNPSGAMVYSNFTDQIANVSAGVSYPLSITAGYAAQSFNEYFRVWIDFNHDGIFDNPAERVFQSGPSPGTVSGSVLIPITAYIGTTRMRVSMKYSSFSTPCQVFPFGEVEDYSVKIHCNMVTTTLDHGPGSLPWAVGCVSSGETISFAANLNGDTILLENNYIDIDSTVSIVAQPLNNISVYGFSTPKVFEVKPQAIAVISGLKIISGMDEGGAIENSGTLLLKDMHIYPHPDIIGRKLILNFGSLVFSGDSYLH